MSGEMRAQGELTQREWARKGAIATNTKYPLEKRREWAKKGIEALKLKYGPDYFIKRAQKMREAKQLKKSQQPKIEANLGY